MKKVITALAAILFVHLAVGQQKEFTLRDAILGPYGSLAPERLRAAAWRPETDQVSQLTKDNKTLMATNPKGGVDTIIKVSQLNDDADSEPQITNFAGYQWVDKTHLYLQKPEAGYVLNVEDKSLQQIYGLGDKLARHKDAHPASGQLAFTIENNLYVAKGNEVLAVTNHDDKNVVAGQAIARSEFGITKGTFWSPNGTMLAFYEKDESDVADYPLLDISTTPGSLKSIKYPMAGQGSEKSAVGIYHTLTRQTVYIKSEKGEYDYLTNVGWSPDEKYIYVAELNRAQNHMKLKKYDAFTGGFVATLFEEQNDKWVEPETPVFFPGKKSNQFVWMSERDGFMNLYLYSSDGKLIRQLTKNKWVAKAILGADPKGKTIYFTGTGENPTETHVFKVSLSGKQTQLTTVAGTHRAMINATGKYFLDAMSSIEIPGNTSIRSTANGALRVTLVESKNPFADYKVSTPELFTITGPDRTTLHCRIIKPTDFDPSKKYPVLVYVYGGPHAQMVTNRFNGGAQYWMNYMAERGYIIFTLDNRGSGNRGWAFESGIHRQLGELEMQDQLAGVDYLKSLPYVDADRMAVHGWSYGGFMTTSLMLRQPGVFKVAVAGGPVTNWAYYEVMYGERYMDMPQENPKGYEKNKVMNYVNNLEGDLLLIHGTIDPVVVMQHNYALVKAFVDAGIQVDFFPYPMHEHNVRGKDRIHLMRKVLDYIDDKLKE